MAKKQSLKEANDRGKKMFEMSVKAKGKDLKKISSLVTQYEVLNGERNALLATADELWGAMLDLQRRVLPAAMAEAGVKDFTDDGSNVHIELDSYLSGTWPKEESGIKKAVAWLKKVKAEDLLKCEVIGKFSRKDAALARKIFEQIKKGGKATAELKERVHPQTLLAFFRDRLKQGKEVPFELFNGETGTFARIDFPKQPKDEGDGR